MIDTAQLENIIIRRPASGRGRMNLGRCRCIWLVVPLVVNGAASVSLAAEGDKIVARVGTESIFQREVDREVSRVLAAGKPVSEQQRPHLQARALDLVIARYLILGYLRKIDAVASSGEIDKAWKDWSEKLEENHLSWEPYLEQIGMTREEFRRQLVWRLNWTRYVERQITDEKLGDIIRAQREEGQTERIRVSHILLRPRDTGDAEEQQRQIARAQDIRQQIERGQLSFEQAARKYSAGPSHKQGGDLGYITRDGEMEKSFAEAAFALEEGEISPPVVSSFGVHLIRCTEKPLTPPEEKVDYQAWRRRAQRHLFLTMATQLRKSAEVEFTGQAPYYHPTTRRLILPKAER